MNADIKHKNLTDAILCCFYTVYNILGYGFQEKLYENALQHEITKRGLSVLRSRITSELRSATGIQKESL